MHTLARPPVREAHLKSQARLRAFTLIELLVVIGIIAILAAITFGVVKGVNERAAIGQAKAELASLAQSLEAYKLQYGDYPRSSTPVDLLQSLIGMRGPAGAVISGKSLIESARFSLSVNNGDPIANPSITVYDPWGRDYLYYYYTVGAPTNITNRGFVLFSRGADGSFAPPNTTGTMGGDPRLFEAQNYDNIYSN